MMILFLLVYSVIYLLYWSIRVVSGTANFVWYDFWIGVFVDMEKGRIYWAGLPCFVIIDEWRKEE